MKPYHEQDDITIYHGDCREVLPDIPRVRLMFTSPPYNCGMDYGQHDDEQDVAEYFGFIEECVNAMSSRLEPGGYLGLNVPSWIGSREDRVFAFDEYKSIAGRHLQFSDLIIWAKSPPNGTAWGNYPTSPRIRASHEWLLVHRAGGSPLGKNDISWAEWSRLTQSIWQIQPNLPYSAKHPATYPVELPTRAIALYGTDGGIVCDPFMGTGTTMEAARVSGRKAIGIELEERYCEIAANRLAQGVLFGNGGAA